MDVEQVSSVDFAAQPREIGDRFVKQGFGAVVASFAHGVPVRLNTPIAKVKHGPSGAEITAWGGQKWRAKTVLTTASTDVLAAEKIKFDPPLPEWKKEAIDALPLATFNKIALQFDKNIFPEVEPGAHVRDIQSAHDAMEFVVSPGGDPVVVGLVGGQYSRDLVEKGEAASIELALSRLEKMFGPRVREHFVKGATTDWDADPWALGAFSCAKPGYPDARKTYEKPVGQTLYFAGEAGDEDWAGCVPGAYLSGKRAAASILESLQEAKHLTGNSNQQGVA
jgi:monoamine oxidase